MTKKPARTLEMQVDVDAPLEEAWKALTEAQGIANWFAPIVKVDRPGLGGKVTVAWSEEMASTATVDAWEQDKQVRWINEGFMGPGTVVAMEWNLEAVGGKTRVRLVQSGFGESEGWDSFFEGTEVGWTYFLYHLRLYLEKHLGKVRHLISERIACQEARDVAWKQIAAATTGVALGSVDAIKPGDVVEVKLADANTVRAIVEVAIPGHALVLRFAELQDAVLFVELEGGGDSFHVGWYLSLYDAQKAKALDSPAKRAFRRIHESLPGK
jgi:uncharacterized protein YndB with AHSA1/START domain